MMTLDQPATVSFKLREDESAHDLITLLRAIKVNNLNGRPMDRSDVRY